MSIRVEEYKDEYWEELEDFIHKEWKKDHPITNKLLFDWQYKGYGYNKPCSKILFINDKIHGFLGGIPSKYQIPGIDEPVTSVSLAVWIVSKEYQQTGVGMLLLKKMLEEFNFCLTVGLNQQVKPIYTKLKFDYTPAYKRYVLPLNPEEYFNILKFQPDIKEIISWYNNITFCDSIIEPSELDSAYCEKLWLKYNNKNYLTLYRNAEFWDWRYKHNTGFNYLHFKPDNYDGLIVSRVEEIISEEPNLNGKKVFRLIELVSDINNSENIHNIINKLLLPVLSWAKAKGCIATDFQCSSDYYKDIFIQAGFLEQDKNFKPDIASLSPLFQPYRPDVNPLNLVWRASKNGIIIPVQVENTIMLKSDGDMDRPNFIN